MEGTAGRDGSRCRGRASGTPDRPHRCAQIAGGAPSMTISDAGKEVAESDRPAPIARSSLGAVDVAIAAQLACLIEASAPKPGNVSPGRHFADARYEDFLASAAAIGEPMAAAGSRPVGATVRLAVEATARWTPSNTNLGIVLLLAPLARAATADKGVGGLFPDGHAKETPDPRLRAAVRRV